MNWLRILSASLLLASPLSACLNEDGPVDTQATLRIEAESDGQLSIVADGLASAPAALQAELVLSQSDHSLRIESTSSVDRTRAENRGGGRFIIFLGDGAGGDLPASGALGRLSFVDASGTSVSSGTVRLASAKLASPNGQLIEIEIDRTSASY